MNKKQKLGQYFSTTNLFNDNPLKVWLNEIPNWETQSLLEPFAGACHILKYFPNREWSCFDIDPIVDNVKYRDGIRSNFFVKNLRKTSHDHFKLDFMF